MEPESRPAGLADALIELLDGFDMAGGASLGREHPAPRLPGELLVLGEAAVQDGGELAGDRKLQWLAALGALDADGHGGHIDPRPCERDHLGEAQAGLEAEAEGVADDRVAHRGLKPRCQRGSASAAGWRARACARSERLLTQRGGISVIEDRPYGNGTRTGR